MRTITTRLAPWTVHALLYANILVTAACSVRFGAPTTRGTTIARPSGPSSTGVVTTCTQVGCVDAMPPIDAEEEGAALEVIPVLGRIVF